MAAHKLPIITGTSLTTGDLLRWDGSNWVNYPDSNFSGGGPGQSAQAVGTDNADNQTGDWADVADMSITITTTGGNVLLMFSCAITAAASGDDAQLRFDIDGSPAGGSAKYNIGTIPSSMAFQWLATSLSAGSHTFKVQWIDIAGTVSHVGTAYGPRVLTAIEVPD